MYRAIITLFTLLLLSSCTAQLPVEVESKESSYIVSPLVITNDKSSDYIAADYLPTMLEIDSITTNGGLTIEPSEVSGVYTIGVDPDSGRLSTITVWSGGKSADQVVIDKRSGEAEELRIFTIEHGKSALILSFNKKPEEVVVMWQNIKLPESYIKVMDHAIRIELPSESADFDHSLLRVYAASREGVYNDVFVPLSGGSFVDTPEQLATDDPHTRVLYSLMVDRFYDGKPENNRKLNRPDVLPIVDYMGGDFVGITEKIEDGYFQKLGINTLWISPITKNPEDAWGLNKEPMTRFSGYHGYWPIYTTVVDDRFGTEEELHRLLEVAHENDMEVILDYVANHLHIDSPLLQANPDWKTELMLPDGRKNLELWDEHRLTTWFDLHIPSMDLGRPDVYEPLTDSALYWLENFAFDGFRHDATKHIPEAFWRTLTQKVHQRITDRNIYQIGETYGSPELIGSYVRSGMLDGQFDFNVYFAARENIIKSDGDMSQLASTISESLDAYGYHHLMGNISGNHDQPRFVSLAGGALSFDEDHKAAGWTREVGVGNDVGYDKLLVYEALLLSLPGLPCIYQGDEFGEPGGNDPDNRKMMRFEGLSEREEAMRSAVAELVHQRTQSMLLLYGTYLPLYSDKDVLVFARTYMGDAVVAAFNKSSESRTVEYKLPLIELKDGEVLKVEIPAYGYKFIEKKIF